MSQKPGQQGNVVVVDDDADMIQAIERLLNAAGFRTQAFPSAESLLEAGAAAQAGCFVLDVHLPGLSGFALRQALDDSGAKAPTIFITGLDEPAARDQAKRAGAVAYFVKPFSGRGLVSVVAKAVGRADAGQVTKE